MTFVSSRYKQLVIHDLGVRIADGEAEVADKTTIEKVGRGCCPGPPRNASMTTRQAPTWATDRPRRSPPTGPGPVGGVHG